MTSAKAIRLSIAARPPKRYGNGECHGARSAMFGLVDGEKCCADGEILSIDFNFFFFEKWKNLSFGNNNGNERKKKKKRKSEMENISSVR